MIMDDAEDHASTPTPLQSSNAAVNIALDLWILAIPLWELRTLQLHWKKTNRRRSRVGTQA